MPGFGCQMEVQCSLTLCFPPSQKGICAEEKEGLLLNMLVQCCEGGVQVHRSELDHKVCEREKRKKSTRFGRSDSNSSWQ